MALPKTHYEWLKIEKTASNDEIKQAYRSQSKIFHPDKNSDASATEDFQKIKAAYEVLIDPARREAYHLELFRT